MTVAEISLTDKELLVLKLLAKGYANKEIAAAFTQSEQNVKNYVADIIHKLGAANRTGAVVTALRLGIINLEEA